MFFPPPHNWPGSRQIFVVLPANTVALLVIIAGSSSVCSQSIGASYRTNNGKRRALEDI